MNAFSKHHQTIKEDSNYLQYLIPGDWMLSHTQNLEGISFFDLPKGGKPVQ